MVSFAVGLTKNLPDGRVMRSFVENHDLVIWRSVSGQLSCWLNRCPHRGMRLSHGFVRGEALACVYHGWHYGKDTACRYIPAHPDLDPPGTIKTMAFSSFDKGGIIWVNIDNKKDEPIIPNNLLSVRSLEFRCPLEMVEAEIPEFEYHSAKKGLLNLKIKKQGFGKWIIEILGQGLYMHLFLHKLPSQKCAIHALSNDNVSSEQRKDMSRLLEHLRYVSEAKYKVLAA
tara:strand:+ start:55 stop:738 length:684 start_codon:yes stop_codon:yes gene_type:complete